MSAASLPGPSRPAIGNPDIAAILALHQLPGQPVLVPYKNTNNYPPIQCHISAKHAAMTLPLGHWRVHGWAFWEYPLPNGTVVFAEFHSVVSDPDGFLFDVTPPRAPVTEILFLRDASLSIGLARQNYVVFRTDLTPYINDKYYFNGKSTPSAEWASSEAQVTKHCNKVRLPFADIVTDPVYG